MVAVEAMGAFNRDPMDLVVTTRDRLVVNHLLEHNFFEHSGARVSFGIPWEGASLRERHPFSMRTPPIVGKPQDSGARRTVYGGYGGRNHHKHNPHKLHDLPVLKRIANRVLDTAKKGVVGGVGLSCTILDMAEISSFDHTLQHLRRDAPPLYSA